MLAGEEHDDGDEIFLGEVFCKNSTSSSDFKTSGFNIEYNMFKVDS